MKGEKRAFKMSLFTGLLSLMSDDLKDKVVRAIPTLPGRHPSCSGLSVETVARLKTPHSVVEETQGHGGV